jgi:hypothetical protein
MMPWLCTRYAPKIMLLGMQAGGHDYFTGVHPRGGTLANLHPITTSAKHLHLFSRRQMTTRQSLGSNGAKAKSDPAEVLRRKGNLNQRPPSHGRPNARKGRNSKVVSTQEALASSDMA